MRDLPDSRHRAGLAKPPHVESPFDITDAPTLRLLVLKDELEPIMASMWKPGQFFDLQLVPGESPRLWLDLVSSVVMAPDNRTYRLVQDTDHERDVLFQTRSRAEMVERVRKHMERPVAPAHDRAGAGELPAARSYSAGALVLAWLSGLVVGILVLFTAGILYTR
jgi:hypothetical protein